MMRTERLILCAIWDVPFAHAGSRRAEGKRCDSAGQEKYGIPPYFSQPEAKPDAPPAACGQVRKSGKGVVLGSVFRVVEG